MLEVSRPLDKRFLAQIPVAIVVFRAKSGDESNFWFTIKDNSDDENWNDHINKIVEMGVRRSAGLVASKLNNTLTSLKSMGERLSKFGSGLEAASDQHLPTDDAQSTLRHPQSAAALLFPRVLVVDDDLQLLEAFHEVLFLNRIFTINAASKKWPLNTRNCFCPIWPSLTCASATKIHCTQSSMKASSLC